MGPAAQITHSSPHANRPLQDQNGDTDCFNCIIGTYQAQTYDLTLRPLDEYLEGRLSRNDLPKIEPRLPTGRSCWEELKGLPQLRNPPSGQTNRQAMTQRRGASPQRRWRNRTLSAAEDKTAQPLPASHSTVSFIPIAESRENGEGNSAWRRVLEGSTVAAAQDFLVVFVLASRSFRN